MRYADDPSFDWQLNTVMVSASSKRTSTHHNVVLFQFQLDCTEREKKRTYSILSVHSGDGRRSFPAMPCECSFAANTSRLFSLCASDCSGISIKILLH